MKKIISLITVTIACIAAYLFFVKPTQAPEIGNPIVTNPNLSEPILCTPESRKAQICTMIYAPVCAKVNVQCIKAPCPPIEETFASMCTACANSLVESYVQGECPTAENLK